MYSRQIDFLSLHAIKLNYFIFAFLSPTTTDRGIFCAQKEMNKYLKLNPTTMKVFLLLLAHRTPLLCVYALKIVENEQFNHVIIVSLNKYKITILHP